MTITPMPGKILVRPDLAACKSVSVDAARGNVLLHLPDTALKMEIEAEIVAASDKMKNHNGKLISMDSALAVGRRVRLHPNVGMMRSGESRRKVRIDDRECWLIDASDVLGVLV